MTVLARPFLGSGLSFPLRLVVGDYVVTSESDQIKESITTILGTRIGERRMLPLFGSNIHRLLFEDMDDPDTQSKARVYTIQAVSLWEPRVTPSNVQLFNVTQGNLSGFAVLLNYVEIQTNKPNNMVYPFFKG